MKIYFCKYFTKYKQSFCTYSRLLLYILKGSGNRTNGNTVSQISFFLRVTIIGPPNTSQKDYILSARFLYELNNQKRPETSYQTSHLVQNICISVYLFNVLGNFQGYILTHAYDTIDVLLNLKNISPFTSSTITMTGPREWTYINLNISGTKQVSRIKKIIFHIFERASDRLLMF